MFTLFNNLRTDYVTRREMIRDTLRSFCLDAFVSFASVHNGCSKSPERLMAEGISREINKHDHWIDMIQQDYRSTAKRKVQIRLVSKNTMNYYKLNGHDFVAGFNPNTNELLFPLPGELKYEEITEHVDHEIMHAFQKHMLKTGDYEGPGPEEINQHMLQKVKGETFAKLRRDLSLVVAQIEVDKAGYEFKKYTSLLNSAGQVHKSLDEYLRMFFNQVPREDLVQSDYAHLDTKIKDFATLYSETRDLRTLMKQVSTNMQNEAFINKKRNLMINFFESAKRFDNLLDRMYASADDLWSICDPLIVSNLETKIKLYQNELLDIDKNLSLTKSVLESAIHALSEFQESRDKRRSKRAVQYKELKAGGLDNLERATYESLDVALEDQRDVLSNPSEIMARLYDAMVSIYHGPVTLNLFPPDANDIEFLGKFRQGGRQIFEKVIKKYVLSTQMINDGSDPRAVRKQLEYATEFEYKGRTYLFPESGFRILGNLPVI